ncbi:MAG: metalloregulator ArsR/SmtB family transcription factor [Blastocatellia bacterium]|nr:metalloregulator ArsR/SmtB family transcription factor [Blastocatellia bacterium]
MSKTAEFDLEQFFLALSDKTRLRIINLIGEDELCVCFFVEVLDELQPKISRHLGVLRETGLVSARKDGKWMHYRVETPQHPHAAKVLADVRAWLKDDQEMQRDRARLVKVCCGSCLPPALNGAPLPASILAER